MGMSCFSRRFGRMLGLGVAPLALCLPLAAFGAPVDLPLVAHLFAPGVISGPASDGAPTFSPDGPLLMFERSNGRQAFLLMAERRGDGWSVPELAPFVEPGSSNMHPVFSAEGRDLVYVSKSLAAEREPAGTRHPVRLVRVTRQGATWSAPQDLPPEINISTPGVFKPSLAANGDLYFMSDGGPGAPAAPQWRLFHARRDGGGWVRAVPVVLPGVSQDDVDPCIAPDQSYLIFSSKGRAPRDDGHEYLFISWRQVHRWGEPVAIRYAGDDWGGDDGEANLGPGGQLFFMSDRVAPALRRDGDRLPTAAYADVQQWNNGNGNVWTLDLAEVLRRTRPFTQ
ncbi:TolB family protein [Roseateles sp. NT4]|uniref:TolB family protein n=1 Tax=Roseateles sp. NT4 TaxID=3453715 RepID=UPI003EED08F5